MPHDPVYGPTKNVDKKYAALAAQSRIPRRHVTLINRASTYAHNDPAGAYPNNAFFAHLIPFLAGISRAR